MSSVLIAIFPVKSSYNESDLSDILRDVGEKYYDNLEHITVRVKDEVRLIAMPMQIRSTNEDLFPMLKECQEKTQKKGYCWCPVRWTNGLKLMKESTFQYDASSIDCTSFDGNVCDVDDATGLSCLAGTVLQIKQRKRLDAIQTLILPDPPNKLFLDYLSLLIPKLQKIQVDEQLMSVDSWRERVENRKKKTNMTPTRGKGTPNRSFPSPGLLLSTATDDNDDSLHLLPEDTSDGSAASNLSGSLRKAFLEEGDNDVPSHLAFDEDADLSVPYMKLDVLEPDNDWGVSSSAVSEANDEGMSEWNGDAVLSDAPSNFWRLSAKKKSDYGKSKASSKIPPIDESSSDSENAESGQLGENEDIWQMKQDTYSGSTSLKRLPESSDSEPQQERTQTRANRDQVVPSPKSRASNVRKSPGKPLNVKGSDSDEEQKEEADITTSLIPGVYLQDGQYTGATDEKEDSGEEVSTWDTNRAETYKRKKAVRPAIGESDIDFGPYGLSERIVLESERRPEVSDYSEEEDSSPSAPPTNLVLEQGETITVAPTHIPVEDRKDTLKLSEKLDNVPSWDDFPITRITVVDDSEVMQSLKETYSISKMVEAIIQLNDADVA